MSSTRRKPHFIGHVVELWHFPLQEHQTHSFHFVSKMESLYTTSRNEIKKLTRLESLGKISEITLVISNYKLSIRRDVDRRRNSKVTFWFLIYCGPLVLRRIWVSIATICRESIVVVVPHRNKCENDPAGSTGFKFGDRIHIRGARKNSGKWKKFTLWVENTALYGFVSPWKPFDSDLKSY